MPDACRWSGHGLSFEKKLSPGFQAIRDIAYTIRVRSGFVG